MARVLVIESEPDLRALLLRQIRRAGHHQAFAAPDGAGALALLAKEAGMDGVLLNASASGPDGFGVLASLRERQPGLPAVFLTGTPSPTVLNRAATMHAQCAPVPVSVAAVRVVLDTLLSPVRLILAVLA